MHCVISRIEFAEELRRQGWCEEFIHIFIDHDTADSILEDHASREKIILAGFQFAEVCSSDELFPTDGNSLKELLKLRLDNWQQLYTHLAKAEIEQGDEILYFSHIQNLIERLQGLFTLPQDVDPSPRTEL